MERHLPIVVVLRNTVTHASINLRNDAGIFYCASCSQSRLAVCGKLN